MLRTRTSTPSTRSSKASVPRPISCADRTAKKPTTRPTTIAAVGRHADAPRRGTAAKATTPMPAGVPTRLRRRGGSVGEVRQQAQRSTCPTQRVRSESSWALPIHNPATTPNVSRQAVCPASSTGKRRIRRSSPTIHRCSDLERLPYAVPLAVMRHAGPAATGAESPALRSPRETRMRSRHVGTRAQFAGAGVAAASGCLRCRGRRRPSRPPGGDCERAHAVDRGRGGRRVRPAPGSSRRRAGSADRRGTRGSRCAAREQAPAEQQCRDHVSDAVEQRERQQPDEAERDPDQRDHHDDRRDR